MHSQVMRKFVNKNRHKRKYTKKNVPVSSFSLTRTFYSILPLLVLLIAFMSTIIISTPFRNSFSQIRFSYEVPQISFEIPQLSFANPFSFLQSLTLAFIQTVTDLWSVLQVFSGFIVQFSRQIFETISYALSNLANIFVLELLISYRAVTFIAQELFAGLDIIAQVFLIGEYFFVNIAKNITAFIVTIAIGVGMSIVNVLFSVEHGTITLVGYLLQWTEMISIAIYRVSVLTGNLIWTNVITVTTFIETAIHNFFITLVHIIDIPFKILYAFWLQIKPYVDFFGKHVQMTGMDLSNGFASWGKVASLMSSSK